MRVASTLLLAVLFCPALALAGIINIPADYPTIQEGIEAAVAGDTIQVAPGTYMENLDFLGKALTLVSTDGPETTTIDGGKAGSVVSFANNETSATVLDGFSITNGNATDGGGIFCFVYSSPTIRNNIIHHNTATYFGGGLYCRDGSLALTGNRFEDNQAYNGGGIYSYFADLTLTDNEFNRNSTTGYGGGGIYATNYTALTMSNDHFTENSAFSGGGIYLNNSPADISECSFDLNTATYNGGGLYVYNMSDSLINNNSFDDNVAANGGGICAYDSMITLTNNVITHNSATQVGGGMSCQSNLTGTISGNTFTENNAVVSGGAIHCNLSLATIEDNDIGPNSNLGINTAPRGGGIACEFDSDCTITENRVKGNGGTTCEFGGGIYINNCSPTIQSNEIGPFNKALSGVGQGGGIFVENSDSLFETNTISGNQAIAGAGFYDYNNECTIRNNTIGPNNVASTGSGGGLTLSDSKSDVTNNLIKGNQATNGGGMAVLYVPTGKVYPRFDGNTFTENHATSNGGGLFFKHQQDYFAVCDRNIIYLNSAVAMGGGIYAQSLARPKITNCWIYNNSALKGGGVATTLNAKTKIKNCVLYKNSATNSAGGFFSNGAAPWLINSIVWANTAGSNPQVQLINSNSVTLETSNIQDGTGMSWFDDATCIDQNPRLINPEPADLANADFHILPRSPCVNMAETDSDVPGDYDQESRSYQGRPDMGTDELYGPIFLEADGFTISKNNGGTINFSLNAGSNFAGRPYMILGGISGRLPGTPLPLGGAVHPVVWDSVTTAMLPKLNSPFLQNFMGTLDASGQATAVFTVNSLGDTFKNKTITFSFILGNPMNLASNPIFIKVKNP